MDLFEVPTFVALKLAMLSDARATAATRADELTAKISNLRDRLNGHGQRADDDPVKVRAEIDRLLVEEKALQRQRPIEAGVIDRCRAWLAGLPSATVLKQVIPDTEDDLSLRDARARIKKMQDTVTALRAVPVPPSDIREKVLAHVQNMTRPIVSGINSGEGMAVQWPTSPHALMAFLSPDVLVDRLMAEIDRIANSPCPLPERKQRIDELEREIDRLQRTEEAIVIATSAPREWGCLPWVVLGVKAVEARGVRVA